MWTDSSDWPFRPLALIDWSADISWILRGSWKRPVRTFHLSGGQYDGRVRDRTRPWPMSPDTAHVFGMSRDLLEAEVSRGDAQRFWRCRTTALRSFPFHGLLNYRGVFFTSNNGLDGLTICDAVTWTLSGEMSETSANVQMSRGFR